MDSFTSVNELKAQAESLGLTDGDVAQYVLRQQAAEREERQREREERQRVREQEERQQEREQEEKQREREEKQAVREFELAKLQLSSLPEPARETATPVIGPSLPKYTEGEDIAK